MADDKRAMMAKIERGVRLESAGEMTPEYRDSLVHLMTMQADSELVRDYVGIDKPFDVKTTYTNEFLDRSVMMTK